MMDSKLMKWSDTYKPKASVQYLLRKKVAKGTVPNYYKPLPPLRKPLHRGARVTDQYPYPASSWETGGHRTPRHHRRRDSPAPETSSITLGTDVSEAMSKACKDYLAMA